MDKATMQFFVENTQQEFDDLQKKIYNLQNDITAMRARSVPSEALTQGTIYGDLVIAGRIKSKNRRNVFDLNNNNWILYDENGVPKMVIGEVDE